MSNINQYKILSPHFFLFYTHAAIRSYMFIQMLNNLQAFYGDRYDKHCTNLPWEIMQSQKKIISQFVIHH